MGSNLLVTATIVFILLFQIYEVVNAINSVSNTGISLTEDQKAKIGWVLALILVIIILYNVPLKRVIDECFGEDIDEHTKKKISAILKFVLVGFTITSPVFDWFVQVANYVIGGIIAIGVIVFITGLGVLILSILSIKTLSLIRKILRNRR